MIIVRYADDTSLASSTRHDARRFQMRCVNAWQSSRSVATSGQDPSVEFGRYASGRRAAARAQASRRRSISWGSPTICSTKSRRRRFPTRAQDTEKANESQAPGDQGRHYDGACITPIPEQGQWLEASRSKATSPTSRCRPTHTALSAFRYHISIIWFRNLRRRSQRHRLTWERMVRLIKRFLPSPRVLHPWPNHRFARQTPEVGAECVNSARSDLCGLRLASALKSAV